ncbi:MAG: hypothetical protein ABIT01_10090 [Thermoanaerobaculia bacterium]
MKWLLATPLILAFSASGISHAGTTPDSKASATQVDKRVLPFIEDDYGRALAQARAQALPLFVEVWAPW